MPTNTVAADSPGEIRRSHDLLQAVTRALEILGSARDPTAALTESFEHATRAFGAEKALLLRVRHGDPPELESIRAQGLEFEQVVACVRRAGTGVRTGDLRAFCAARLPAWKVPRQIVDVDALPRDARGKVSRGALEQLIAHTRPRGE